MLHKDILAARAHIESGGTLARKTMLAIIDTYLSQHAMDLCMESTIHRLVKQLEIVEKQIDGKRQPVILRHRREND